MLLVFLNLVIAIMGDTYNLVQETLGQAPKRAAVGGASGLCTGTLSTTTT